MSCGWERADWVLAFRAMLRRGDLDLTPGKCRGGRGRRLRNLGAVLRLCRVSLALLSSSFDCKGWRWAQMSQLGYAVPWVPFQGWSRALMSLWFPGALDGRLHGAPTVSSRVPGAPREKRPISQPSLGSCLRRTLVSARLLLGLLCAPVK